MPMEGQEAERLVRLYGSRIYAFCRKLALKQSDADDLYQQTFLRVLVMPRQMDMDHNPAGFLMAIAARIWRDEIRKYARRQRIAPIQDMDGDISSVATAGTTENEMEKKQLQADIRMLVEHLPDNLRVPVLLQYMGQLSTVEIARLLGIPQGTVKSRLHQARQQLKKELEGIGHDEKNVFGR